MVVSARGRLSSGRMPLRNHALRHMRIEDLSVDIWIMYSSFPPWASDRQIGLELACQDESSVHSRMSPLCSVGAHHQKFCASIKEKSRLRGVPQLIWQSEYSAWLYELEISPIFDWSNFLARPWLFLQSGRRSRQANIHATRNLIANQELVPWPFPLFTVPKYTLSMFIRQHLTYIITI